MVIRKSYAWVLAALVVSGPAAAHRVERHTVRVQHGAVYARVIAVRPIVRDVRVERPRQVCREDVEYRAVPNAPAIGPTIAGGLVGAAIGHELGDHRNRGALAFLGALAGSTAGHEWAARHAAPTTTVAVPVERCHTVMERHVEQVVEGYQVTYQYRGHRYSTRTLRHPGERIRLDASLRPVVYR
jgi:uncharacterized protein YcfJ